MFKNFSNMLGNLSPAPTCTFELTCLFFLPVLPARFSWPAFRAVNCPLIFTLAGYAPMTTTLPPAFSIFSCADFENLCA